MRALLRHSLLVYQFSGIHSTISDDIQRAVSLIYGTTCLIVVIAVVVVAAVAVAVAAAVAAVDAVASAP